MNVLLDLVRLHQFSPLEIVAVMLALGCLSIVAVDWLFDGMDALKAWWTRRRMQPFLTGGSTHADPSRIHRETARDVERLASRVPAAKSGVSVAGAKAGRGGVLRSGTAAERLEARHASQPVDDPGPAEAAPVADVRGVDRASGYGTGTRLIGRFDPETRVNRD